MTLIQIRLDRLIKMKKFYTERSLASRWDKALPQSVTCEVLKNIRRVPYSKNIFQSETKFASSTNPHCSPKSKVKNKETQNTKLENLISRISTVTESKSKSGMISERIFKNRVKSNIKSIHYVDPEEEHEKKQVVRQFSDNIKGSMFTISKSGQKFREINLRKKLGQYHTKSNF